MFKVVLTVKRKAGLTREQYRDRYESGHVPMAIAQLPTLRKYKRNFVQMPAGAKETPFDSITEFYFEDEAAWDATKKLVAGAAGDILAADEAEFMDRRTMRFYVVDERESIIER
jgi:hypothetical protein